MTDNKGQALVENLVCLVALKIFVMGFLFVAYQIAIIKWVDFWSYRTLICLIEHKQKYHCENILKERMSLLLAANKYRIDELWLTRQQAKIKLTVDIYPLSEKIYQKQIDLPLTSF